MINVDEVITISLEEHPARRERMKQELPKLKLPPRFLIERRDQGHEARGCFNSHLKACQEALQKGAQHLLVFEDDARILSFRTSQIKAINTFLQYHLNEFDILYLGLIIKAMWFCRFPRIVRAVGAGSHAYILSRRGMEKLSRATYTGVPIDKLFKRTFKCYSVYPIIAEQYPETDLKSTIAMARHNNRVKDHFFWERNYAKQRLLPWKYMHKTFLELFYPIKNGLRSLLQVHLYANNK